jgi:hypothetical protein
MIDDLHSPLFDIAHWCSSYRTFLQNCWVSGFCTTFRKKDLFPSSGEGSQTATLLGRLESAKFTRPVIEVSSF